MIDGNKVSEMLLAPYEGEQPDRKYAHGYARSAAIIWSMLNRMSEEDRTYWIDRIEYTGQREKEAIKVAESIT